MSCEKYFLPNYEKQYFVFTDAEHLYNQEHSRIIKYYQESLGWPHNTLLRFDFFLKAEKDLADCDYLFFFNGNIKFVDIIKDDILPDDSNDGLLAVLHPGFFNKTNLEFTYERDSRSMAYIPHGQGQHYFMGGFNGGKKDAYLKLIKTLSTNIHTDKEKDIIALWHDESHLNNYFLNKNPKVLSPEYGYPEEFIMPFKPKIIILNKNKYGGHDYLRNNTNVKIKIPGIAVTFFKRITNKLSKLWTA